MKKSALIVLTMLIGLMMIMSITIASAAEEKGKMMTATGKVTSVDPQGTAITISAKAGNQMEDVGVIVNEQTVVKVKGKKASLSEIKPGDTVQIRYLKSDNLYAKEITKK